MTITLSDAAKEKIKLRATFVNNLGVGVILVGVFTPVTRAVYDPSLQNSVLILMGASAAVCFFLGVALHFVAQTYLNRLDR